ncbi:hypothetical protein [Paenarthrobacter sp. PH39-S1]|uniref:hypothetical protein n=1 Tax=Paenarthrobacter sp. PH39-S1 TaxID=3046204 RepID=UPI0024BB9809|nr:hypothetical protein [Paenarthrobacter sp. PH39-S1]
MVTAADDWLTGLETIYDNTVDALTQWARLEARVTAGKAREVEQLPWPATQRFT